MLSERASAHQGSATDQVRAQSLLLQRLGEMMASAVEPVMVAKARTKHSVSKAPNKPEAAPAIPAVEPIRTDLEVFRF